jgi:hypothetical protein
VAIQLDLSDVFNTSSVLMLAAACAAVLLFHEAVLHDGSSRV